MSLENTVICTRKIRQARFLWASFAGFSVPVPEMGIVSRLLDPNDTKVSLLLGCTDGVELVYAWIGRFLAASELNLDHLQIFRLHYHQFLDTAPEDVKQTVFGEEFYRGRSCTGTGKPYTEVLGLENLWGPRTEDQEMFRSWVTRQTHKKMPFVYGKTQICPTGDGPELKALGWLPHPGVLPEEAHESDFYEMAIRNGKQPEHKRIM